MRLRVDRSHTIAGGQYSGLYFKLKVLKRMNYLIYINFPNNG